MSKSLNRVKQALLEAGLPPDFREMAAETRTARQAADGVGCTLDQIVKSIIFRGEISGHIKLFLTAGGNQVDATRASALAGEALGKADANLIRAETGFAIGGVSPLGHLNPVVSFFDPRLFAFDLVWAAAGTPSHVFSISPQDLHRITGATSGAFTADPA